MAYHHAMVDPRQAFLDDVRRYVQAGHRLAAGVTEFMQMNEAALVDLEAGMSVTESFTRRDSAGWSRRVSSLIDEFEACRRDTRSSAAAVLLEEGRTVTDVGRAFGVSHQLASRFAKGAGAPGLPGDGAAGTVVDGAADGASGTVANGAANGAAVVDGDVPA